jgi:hypothetical protein
VNGVHLMSLTKWKDYVLASGYDLGPSELTGVFQVCTR